MDSEPPNPGLLFFSSFFFLSISASTVIPAMLILLLLLFCSAMISGSEVAYFSLDLNDINELEEEKSRISKQILKLKRAPRTLLATILISNNFINIAIVLLSEFIIWNVLSDQVLLNWGTSINNGLGYDSISPEFTARTINILITTVGVTFLLVLFGEVAPKIYAKLNNIRLARFMSGPLSFLSFIFGPFSKILVSWGRGLEKRLDKNGINSASKEDLDAAIELAVNNEQDSEEERGILKGIVKFSDISVKQIMQPRTEVIAANIEMSYAELLKLIKDSGYSRIPVFTEDLDNISGILYAKDLLGFLDAGADFEWQALIRTKLLYVPESKKLNDLLKEIQTQRLHLGIVVNEYGGTEGLVTLEDLMEEVVGEIRDEFDEEHEIDVIKLDSKNFIFDAKTSLNDAGRVIGLESDIFDEVRGDSDSLAGLILEHAGSMPQIEYEMTHENLLKLKVLSVSDRRIEKIKLTLL